MNETKLIAGVSIHQLICWGTLHSSVPAFIGPMEAAFGWSRADISGAVTAGLLTAGLVAIPVGRFVDRHGSHGVMTLGAALGVLALLAWAAVPGSLVLFYLLWIGIGAVQALAFSEPAYAALTANSRDPRRAVVYSTFLTGLTTTMFLPLTAFLVEVLGWRPTLLAFAALQLVPAVTVAILLRGARGSLAGVAAEERGRALRRAMRRRAFWGLAATFCAHAFTMIGMGFHMLPLLQEFGLPLASAVLVITVQGPSQVVARTVLFAFGRFADIRPVGMVAVALQPLAMLLLALSPPSLPVLLLFMVLFGAGSGLMTILRVSGVAEILGREGFGEISGAITTAAVLPRTAAPLALALVWEWGGGYGPVPWVVLGISALGALGFCVAALDRPVEGGARGG